MEKIRLSKLMAQRGLCSRREADVYIEKGWVRVNDEPVAILGTRVLPDVRISLDQQAHQHQQRAVTLLLNKPVGYVSGQPEDGYAPAISLVTPSNQYRKEKYQRPLPRGKLAKLAPAGRLDIDSTGLLVFTQDGRIARQLIGQQSNIDKEYLVRVEGKVTTQALTLLCHGLSLDNRPLKPAKVTQLNPNQLKFILYEGRKRQIRRMCRQVGLKVVALKRVRIGGVILGPLPEGQWRYLGANERF